jgi:purine nucleosidase
MIIIDTDPGVDDALALAFAIAAQLPVVGVTTVFGNATVSNTTRNALTILELMKSVIPVYQGAALPLAGTPVLPQSHGDNGLGGYSRKRLRRRAEPLSAIEFIIRTLEQGKTTIVCMGPSTNVALVTRLRPDLVANIQKLIILGGVFFEKGNMTPVAEFNVLNDPYACHTVLSLPCPRTIIPINVCRKVIATKTDFEQITNRLLRRTFLKITDLFIRYYTSDDEYAGFSGAVMYDLLTIAYLLQPSLFTTVRRDVAVETASPLTYAQTVMLDTTTAPATIAVDVDGPAVLRLFFERINASQ